MPPSLRRNNPELNDDLHGKNCARVKAPAVPVKVRTALTSKPDVESQASPHHVASHAPIQTSAIQTSRILER